MYDARGHGGSHGWEDTAEHDRLQVNHSAKDLSSGVHRERNKLGMMPMGMERVIAGRTQLNMVVM